MRSRSAGDEAGILDRRIRSDEPRLGRSRMPLRAGPATKRAERSLMVRDTLCHCTWRGNVQCTELRECTTIRDNDRAGSQGRSGNTEEFL